MVIASCHHHHTITSLSRNTTACEAQHLVLHVVRSDLYLYVCLKPKAGLQEEIAQGCHLANHVEVLKAQLVSAGLEPASADDDDDDDDYVSCHILHWLGCFLCGAFAVLSCSVKQQVMQPV